MAMGEYLLAPSQQHQAGHSVIRLCYRNVMHGLMSQEQAEGALEHVMQKQMPGDSMPKQHHR